MKKEIDAKHIATVCAALMSSDAKSAVKYLDDKTIVRATWHNKPMSRNRSETMVVTIGAPNYRERATIARYKRDYHNPWVMMEDVFFKQWPKKAK